MPNVSASLSDEAYIIWRDHQGNKSQWISDLVINNSTYPARVEALNRRIDVCFGLLAESFRHVNAFRGGSADDITDKHALLLQQKILDQLEGTLHYFIATRD
jgi:hypothetical protein